MKVRLLKKVRKQFTIDKIESLGSNPDNLTEYYAGLHGLPFFRVYDDEDCFGYDISGFRTLPEAVEDVRKRILKRYSEKFRHKDVNRIKAWWVK